jgi:group I intron endonuclease
MSGFIYLWKNNINGKKYIGRHKGCEHDSYIGSGKHFRRAVSKYGLDNFERIILEYVEDESSLKEREKYYLDFFDAATNKNFYNISPNSHGGHHGKNNKGENNPMYGKKHPNHKPHFGEENGMFGSNRVGSLNPMYGKTHDDKSRNKISEGAKRQKKHTCVHCGLTSTASNIKRWHNENCKKGKNDIQCV